MASLLDTACCEGQGWNPRLFVGVRAKSGRFEYHLWNPGPMGLECHFVTKDRAKAILAWRQNPGAVLRMQLAASDRCIGIAMNDGSGLIALPEEWAFGDETPEPPKPQKVAQVRPEPVRKAKAKVAKPKARKGGSCAKVSSFADIGKLF